MLKKYINERARKKSESDLRALGFLPITDTQPGDVFIVGFPKSGHTWMQSLVASLYFGIVPKYLEDRLTQDLIPDIYSRKTYKRYSPICFFKSHELPGPTYKRVIYLVRDGRDAMVSYYHMQKVLKRNSTLEDMVLNNSNVYPCGWHTHVGSWLKNPHHAEMLIVKYENLVNQGLIELRRIADFLNISRSEDELSEIVIGHQFNEMKARIKKVGFDHPQWKENGELFFRKGQIGDYVNEFTTDLLAKFNEDANEMLRAFNYKID